jgi:hypothetical protein
MADDDGQLVARRRPIKLRAPYVAVRVSGTVR